MRRCELLHEKTKEKQRGADDESDGHDEHDDGETSALLVLTQSAAAIAVEQRTASHQLPGGHRVAGDHDHGGNGVETHEKHDEVDAVRFVAHRESATLRRIDVYQIDHGCHEDTGDHPYGDHCRDGSKLDVVTLPVHRFHHGNQSVDTEGRQRQNRHPERDELHEIDDFATTLVPGNCRYSQT